MGPLLAALMAFVRSRYGTGLAVGVGAQALSDLGIDVVRAQAVKLAPTSDPEALEEAARQLMRMLGLDGSDVVFPPGGPAKWNYFHMDMRDGKAWWTNKYISKKGQKALIRSITAAPSRIVGGGSRAPFRSTFRR